MPGGFLRASKGCVAVGKHSKPSTHSSTGPLVAVAIATSGAFASVPLTQGVAVAAPQSIVYPSDDGWDSVGGAIESCESGNRLHPSGDPRARNPSSSASGAWQLIRGTWASVGGLLFAPSAAQATLEQQETAARRLFDRDGLSPWQASRSCWRRRIGMRSSAPVATPVALRSTGGRHRRLVPSRPSSTSTRYTVRAGDSLSSIAAEHGHRWEDLFAQNRATVSNPDLIHVGLVINL